MKMYSSNIVIKSFYELTLDELYELLRLRSEVFVVEQNCPYQDLDNKDQDSIELYLRVDGVMVACARILKPGVSSPLVTIGRVVTKERFKGYGRAIMESAIQYIKENTSYDEIYIMAQVQAMPFYEKLGFVYYGDEFLEDDIPHHHMTLKLR